MSDSSATIGVRGGRRPPQISAPLLEWFAEHRRDLPWRTEPRDAYRTWVSEVMLQQTRVDVVVPYFHRFLQRFPTLQSLAEAPRDDVLAQWSGLGYYTRARNLHEAARAALQQHGGLPRTLDALSALPGFGPYTAAAVASLAFGVDAPLVDGNVARVLGRVLCLEGDPAKVRAAAWKAAPALLPHGHAGEFNEALMELGATVCTPRSPRCEECPLQALCGARAEGRPEAYPAPKPQRVRPQLTWAAVLVRGPDDAVLLQRRPEGALFAGLWDLPSAEVNDGDALGAARAVLRALGGRGTLSAVGEVEQTLTHRELRVVLFAASGAVKLRDDQRWVPPTRAAFGTLGLSSLARKSLRACGITAAAAMTPRKARTLRMRTPARRR